MGRDRRSLAENLLAAVALLAAPLGLSAQDGPPEAVEPAPHIAGWPDLRTGASPEMREASWSLGPEMQRGRFAREMLEDRRLLDDALEALAPQRRGTVDAYVLVVALDSDPVFAREAREAGRVLARRYGAAGRTLVLAGPDGKSAELPKGSISSLTVALARIAELMDPREDVLVLYSTSHGAPEGLVYHYGDTGYGVLSPPRLRDVLGELGIARRILMLSACYSGGFVPYLATPDTALVTAAAHDKPSFGCNAQNDWTFFGDALVNNALRKPQPLPEAVREARVQISSWEIEVGLDPSMPQVSIGDGVSRWLSPLEAQMPREGGTPVGRPAMSLVRAPAR